MKLKSIFSALCLSAVILTNAQDSSSERLFPYPEPPEELTTLADRTTYLVNHFWDRCNLKSTILRRDDFRKAFIDYISFMPYADADAVHESINKLISTFTKEPDNLLTLGEIAEQCLYGPDAEFISDEVYLPFAKAVVDNKKISSQKKERFKKQVNILSNSQVGMTFPDIEYVRPDGTKDRISAIKGGHVLIFVYEPDSFDCRMARVRLSADPNINDLIDAGLLNVVCLFPVKPTDEWISSVSGYNYRWIVGSAPDIAEDIDMRNFPVLYYLNPAHKILSKTLVVDNLLEAFRIANSRVSKPAKVPAGAIPTDSVAQ